MLKLISKYPCHCCGYLVYLIPPPGDYDICPVCRWVDDLTQNEDPNFAGGPNKLSLNEAREFFKAFGACQPDMIAQSRKPYPSEIP